MTRIGLLRDRNRYIGSQKLYTVRDGERIVWISPAPTLRLQEKEDSLVHIGLDAHTRALSRARTRGRKKLVFADQFKLAEDW